MRLLDLITTQLDALGSAKCFDARLRGGLGYRLVLLKFIYCII